MLFLLFPSPPQASWSWDITSGRMKDVQYKSFTIKKKVSVYASVSVKYEKCKMHAREMLNKRPRIKTLKTVVSAQSYSLTKFSHTFEVRI